MRKRGSKAAKAPKAQRAPRSIDAAVTPLKESIEPAVRPMLLACERRVTAGTLTVNDAYDLLLYRLPDGHFEVVVFMKLQFFFEPGPGGDWTQAQQQRYVRDWRAAIESVWGGHRIHRTACGRSVALRFEFDIQVDGWMLDHWEITITKIVSGGFTPSCVDVRRTNVRLDSEDLSPVFKHGQLQQRGAVHEFGHMLGLADEYSTASSDRADRCSVMSHSEAIRPHHHDTMRRWVIRKLAEQGFQ